MNIINYISMVAGAFTFISALLGYLHDPRWLFFTMFVGLNLFQSAFTNWCPLISILKKFGVKD